MEHNFGPCVFDLQLPVVRVELVQFAFKLESELDFFLVVPLQLHVLFLQLHAQAAFVVLLLFELLRVGLQVQRYLFQLGFFDEF